MKFSLAIPTLNGEKELPFLLKSIQQQALKPSEILVIDSSSTDTTAQIAKEFGAKTLVIPKSSFNHGRTRQQCVELLKDSDIICFMTQDAILANSYSLKNLYEALLDPKIAACYGRQLPHKGAKLIESHARLFNYPASSHSKSKQDLAHMGFKAFFFSDSFSAYKRDPLMKVGGFPTTSFGEDTIVAAKMILNGMHVGYCSEAQVHHSHAFSFAEEFKRSREVGRFHKKEQWMFEETSSVENEGIKFVLSELKFLAKNNPFLIPSAICRTILKFSGYQLGRRK